MKNARRLDFTRMGGWAEYLYPISEIASENSRYPTARCRCVV